MLNKPDFLADCVLTAIADDYENFDKILDETMRVADLKNMEVDRKEVAEALERTIEEGTAEAFVLSAQPPECRKVTYSRDRLDELWFYVTRLGKEKAKSLDKLISWPNN